MEKFKIIAWPVEPPIKINQVWGNNPNHYKQFGWTGGHEGIDLHAPLGAPIFAVAQGIISYASDKRRNGKPSAYGWRVEIKHAHGYSTLYAHLDPNTPVIAIVGTEVVPGQVIGFSGNTGKSTGPHLHLSLLKEYAKLPGFPANYINPTPFFEEAFNHLRNCSQLRTKTNGGNHHETVFL